MFTKCTSPVCSADSTVSARYLGILEDTVAQVYGQFSHSYPKRERGGLGTGTWQQHKQLLV